MSYTSSDPENIHRETNDSISLASTSTTTSQLSKTKKKPWSKFKSSLKSIGGKMSGKPKFTEPTESSEQKRTKKNKKFKSNSISGESIPSTSEESPREKSPTKGSKSIIKKLSVESISTPFVGLQPSTVNPGKSYAKALHKSGSTSESNLSTSDIDSPKKYLTLDKNTKYSLDSQGSPDSGRLSQHMESSGSLGSRPPSQITEEGYGSGTQKEGASDVSVDSDSTTPQRPGRRSSSDAPFYNLVAKTEQFAKSVRVPTPEKDLDVSVAFIKAETTNTPVPVDPVVIPETKITEVKKKAGIKESPVEENSKTIKEPSKTIEPPTSQGKVTDVSSENEGHKPRKSVGTKSDGSKTADFIKSEQKSSKNIDVKTTGDKTKLDSDTAKKVDSESKNTQEKPKNPDTKEQQPTSEHSKSEEQPPTVVAASVADKNKKDDKNVDTKKLDEIPKKGEAEKKDLGKPDDPLTGVKDESSEKSKSGDKSISPSPKLPPKSLSLASPSSDAGASSPSALDSESMSVEEKLEAFLSAEGWPGPVKDVPVKASARGSQQSDKRECLYKILVIGELGTGKTSIIKRYVHQFFSQHYRATIGVDFALKVINWDPSTIIRLQLWDIAGQERFGNMTRVYYKEAVGAFIVFDVTRSATFDAVLKWKQDLDSKVQLADGSSIPCVLLANKCDQQKEGIINTPAKMDEYCKENNFSAWFETSAKENINIDDAAKSLVSQILQNDKMSQNGRDSSRDSSKFPLEGKPDDQGRSCAC